MTTTIEALSAFAPLAALDRTELATLARAGQDVCFRRGQRLIVEGRHADRCWLIDSGQVVLDAAVPGRGEVVVQTLGPGELLGWSWLVPPHRWQFGAIAAEPVRAIEFDAQQLVAMADADPRFGHALTLLLFGALLDRLQATRARLLDLYGNPGRTSTGAMSSGAAGGAR